MTKRPFETEAPATIKSGPVQESAAPDNETITAADYALRLHDDRSVGNAPHPAAQAAALTQASGGQLARAGSALLQLQRGFGNRYVQRVVSHARPPSPLPATPANAIQRQTENEEPLQGKFETAPRMKNRTGLPDGLKAGIESLSGISLDNVKVHYNSSQPAQLNALAYAQGSDIHVAPGQERHLPHEAWHVVQQAQGRVQPTMELKDGVPVNDDQDLEREADIMGERAVVTPPQTIPRTDRIKPLHTTPSKLQLKTRLNANPPEQKDTKKAGGNATGKQLPEGKYPKDVMEKFVGNSDTQRYTSSGYPHLSIVFTHNNDGTVSIGQGSHYSIAANDNREVNMDDGTYKGTAPAGYPNANQLASLVDKVKEKLKRSADEHNAESQRDAKDKFIGKEGRKINENAKTIGAKVKQILNGQEWNVNEYQKAAELGWTDELFDKAWAEIKQVTNNKSDRVAQLEATTDARSKQVPQRAVQPATPQKQYSQTSNVTRTSGTLIQRRNRPSGWQNYKFRKAMMEFHDTDDATCNTRAEQVFKYLSQSEEFRDKGNKVGSVYLGWQQNDGPTNHTAATVEWDDGKFVVDTTIQQFVGYRGRKIFIGTIPTWIAAVKKAVTRSKKDVDLNSFQVDEKTGAPFDEGQMIALQLGVRRGSRDWYSGDSGESV